jgi:signal transduction histidine kinase
MIASAVISTASAYLSDRLRRATFRQFVELETAHERIERAIRVLSREIRGGPGREEDLGELSERLVAQKLELERAIRFTTVAKQEANHALQVRDEFISIASHELKTPLTVLKLQNDLLRMKLARAETVSSQDVRHVVTKSDAQIQRLSRLVEDLLENSRMHSNQMALTRERVDLAALVAEVVERFAPQFATAGIDARLEIIEPAIGYWDRLKLEQVVTNLFTNAIKYAPGKPLRVRISRDGVLGSLEVADQGSGIDPKFHRRIFERFERIDSKTSIAGLGLGLYIVRKIIETHGGDIRVESSVGKGARFIVLLPVAPETHPEPVPTRAPAETLPIRPSH